MRVLSAPISVFLAITSRCNLRCKHCNVGSAINSGQNLSFDEWIHVFDKLVEARVLKLWISGGEPLMRPDIFDLLDRIVELPLFIDGFNTNGVLVGPEKAKKLASYKKLACIQVSLDGASPGTHDPLRGTGTFKKTVEGIRMLVEAGCSVHISTTVNKYNLDDLPAIAALGSAVGVSSVRLTPLLELGNACFYGHEIGITRANLLSLAKETVPRILEQYGTFVCGPLPDISKQLKKIVYIKKIIKPDMPVKNFHGCQATVYRCTIRHDGEVIPCDRLWDFTAGSILKTSLLEIWKDSEAFNLFRKRFSTPIDVVEECKGCSFNGVCSGGCPAVSFASYKRLEGFDRLSCHKFFTDDEFCRKVEEKDHEH